MTNTPIPVLYLEDGSEQSMPWRWEICGRCDGHGQSSEYLGAYTREEFDDAGPEFQEDYLSGAYDRPCEYCDGGKIRAVQLKKMSKSIRRLWDAQCREQAETRAIERAELRAEGHFRDDY